MPTFNMRPNYSYEIPPGATSWCVVNDTDCVGSYQIKFSGGSVGKVHNIDPHKSSAIIGGDYSGCSIQNTGNTLLVFSC
jgi:hypothetical protein